MLTKSIESNREKPGVDGTSLPEPTRDKQVDQWLLQLNASLIEEKPVVLNERADTTYSLFYVLFPSAHRHETQLKIQLVLARHLKSGGLGVPKRFRHTSYSNQRYLYAIDNEFIARLNISEYILENGVASSISIYDNDEHSYYSLSGKLAEEILPELIATGRCHWQSLRTPAFTLTEPRVAQLHWKMDEEGYQKLYFFEEDQPCLAFCINKAWYVDYERCQIGKLETGLNDEATKLLFSAPKLPPQHAKEVTQFLAKNEEKTHPIRQPKVLAQTVSRVADVVPCLRLFKLQIKSIHHNDKHAWNSSIISTDKAVAELSFDYEGIRIPWNDKRDIVARVVDDKLVRVIRNRQQEGENIEKLAGYPLTLIELIPSLSRLNRDYLHYLLIDDVENDPLRFTTHILPELRAAGFRIEIDANYPYQVFEEVDDWYSSIEESSYDWFSLELGITIQGEKINLLPVLQKLLQSLRIKNEKIEIGTDPMLVQLPDGRYIQLPSERVRHILSVLVELYDSESLSEDDLLCLSKLHALRLLELEKALGAARLRWFGGESLRKLGSKLLEFKGIQEVAVPIEFRGELRTYQREGLSWLQFLREYEFGGILADDMGLGKTIQTLSHILLEKTSGRMTKPCLVVAPTSLMFNWRMETERFCPSLKVLVLHGGDRKEKFDLISEYDLILTTYGLLVRDKEILLKKEFHLFILDEAQFIKNAKNLATHVALQIKALHRLCLTGTPMENHLGELWSLFHFMMPGLLGDQVQFNRLFRTPIERHGDEERRHHLNRRLAPFLLRRTKDKVVKELPEKIEMIRQVELEGGQRDLYETIRMTMQQKIRKEIAKLGLARSHIIILDALLKLRQICCDPRLLKTETTQKVGMKSAKLELLSELITELVEDGRRILLFSQFTEMLSLIEEELKKKQLNYVKLTGSTVDRETPVREFQGGNVPLFLISLKAGGTGLNLTAADTVIHYDPWWNPAVENQATGRAHRIGQSNTVFVYKLVTKGTVEEKILEMQRRKQALMEGLFSDEVGSSKAKLTEADLQALFDPLEAI